MCGITGLAWREPRADSQSMIVSMTDAITHRGPDSDGHLASNDQRVWLGFR